MPELARPEKNTAPAVWEAINMGTDRAFFPAGLSLASLAVSWASFWGALGVPLALLGYPLGLLGRSLASTWRPLGAFLSSVGSLLAALRRNLKGNQNLHDN